MVKQLNPLQAGEPQKAVDCCVLLSQWDQAVQLAQQYNIPQVQALLFKYAAMLLEQGKTMAAVQLYRKVSSERSALIQGQSNASCVLSKKTWRQRSN